MSQKKLSTKSKDIQKIVDLRRDSNLFGRLYIASQVRQVDVNEFFAHENCSCPPSIYELGKLRKTPKKSDVVSCITKSSNVTMQAVREPVVSALLIDGAELIHMLPPQSSRTFSTTVTVVRPYIQTRLKTVDTVDIVFDQYIQGSLKTDTRQSRGTGPKIKIKPNVVIPKYFSNFLAQSENKQQLFEFLARSLVEMKSPTGKQVICTSKNSVLGWDSNSSFDDISPTSHEEADARLLLHVWHAGSAGHTKINIKTVDSDVVVIAMYAFSKLNNVEELWLEYSTGQHLQYLPIHEIHAKIPDLPPSFHAFTGADTVSSFGGIGKTSAWKTWMPFREVDKAFLKYSTMPLEMLQEDDAFSVLQHFVALLYHSSSHAGSVNEVRRILFCQCNRFIENIPPTSEVLFCHLKRTMLVFHMEKLPSS